MRRDPPAGDAYTDRADLLVSDPDARESGDAPRLDVERAERADDGLLDVADVAVQVAAIGLQVEDGVADELAGAVVGDVAAATGLEQLDRIRGALSFVEQHVRRVTRRAERDDVRVLKQQERVIDVAGTTPADELLLQLQPLCVGDGAEPGNTEAA